MIVDLREATLDVFSDAVFDHEVADDGADPWYFGDIDFAIDPARQLRLIAELFRGRRAMFSRYSFPAIEQGLWCMMSGSREYFTGLVWNPALPLPTRRDVVRSVYSLYDEVLAAYPYEEIDFRNPDADERRFRTIDYMAPDLLLTAPWFREEDAADRAEVNGAFLDLFAQLLSHDAPVARYAALHGLGHLEHPDRVAVIDRYLADNPWLEPNQRGYAEAAQRGAVL